MQHPDVTGFFDQSTNTVSYVVVDPATRKEIEDAGLAAGEIPLAMELLLLIRNGAVSRAAALMGIMSSIVWFALQISTTPSLCVPVIN